MAWRTLVLILLGLAAVPARAAEPVPMAAHRALYQLSLEKVRGGDVGSARGTMAYEVTDACDGWATRQRLSLDITNREGQEVQMVSDYITWESKDGLSLRFRTRQTTDTAVTDQAEGDATLDGAGQGGTIRYTAPKENEMQMPKGTLFPMAHTEAILKAAAEGKRFLGVPIFDGTGDKGAQDSSVAIIDWNGPGPAPYPALADLSSGRVRIAFFDRKRPATSDRPAGSPDYEVGMKYWANGVADDLHMDFNDFVMQGRLKEFALLPPHC